MGKFALFRSIGRAYGFGFGCFGTALAICWLPYALIAAAAYFLLLPPVESFFQLLPSIPLPDAGPLANADHDEDVRRIFTAFLPMYSLLYRSIILFFLVSLLLRAMVAVGLTRASAGLEENGFFYFSLGASVWKLFGAWLATYLILYAAQVVLIFLAVLVGMIAGVALIKIDMLAAIGLCILLVLAVLCATIYIKVRLNFFLPPVVVFEKKLDILRSWTLSEGNFWRIIVLYIAICPPFLIFIAVLFAAELTSFVIFVPHFLNFITRPTHIFDWQLLAQISDWLLPWIPPLAAVAFLAYVLFAAMLYAATARAYRGMVATDIASQTPG